jgi:site-specific DNA-methyltransferase (adenine-specific)
LHWPQGPSWTFSSGSAYNLTKGFGSVTFIQRSIGEYATWLESWLPELLRTLKPTASVYICGDWRSSAAIQSVAGKYLRVRNRITWEREKGRGAKSNWKNVSEDIWFCTVSDDFTFNTDAVKINGGCAPHWRWGAPGLASRDDGDFRLTHPSNSLTDLTVPFWSMPENTDHPTQKPEKLLAKLLVASTHPEDVVFDPFLGSGTASVVAKKLGRRYVGNEIDPWYACLAEKRLATVDTTALFRDTKMACSGNGIVDRLIGHSGNPGSRACGPRR